LTLLIGHRWKYQHRPAIKLLFRSFVVALFVGTIATTAIFSRASQLNYPGGYALRELHKRSDFAPNTTLHISVAAAQTGVSRFGQLYDSVLYSKVEQWTEEVQPSMFEWMLTDEEGVRNHTATHNVVAETLVNVRICSIAPRDFSQGFERIAWTLSPPFIDFVQKPMIFTMKRKQN
jgi:hypothetical protein